TDGDGSHGSTSKTPSYTKSVSWHHYPFLSWLSSSKNKKWKLRKRRVMKLGDLMALTAIRIPEWVHLKAAHVLSQFRARRIHPCRMHGSGNLSLKVNHRWRLLSRDGGQNWEVMSHERYSKLKDKK
ncbi:hypothetical protein, partial [Enterobacter kobei]|uniref:ParE family toxin-like protein n=3 Tax=Enterobacter kobei TaxID=208224 RepID=UPI0039C9DAED